MSSESRTRVRVCASRGYEIPMTKAQCNQMCLQLPVQFGYQCRGFHFEPYKLEVFSHDESGDSPDLVYASGACELYKATLSEKDLVRQETDIGKI